MQKLVLESVCNRLFLVRINTTLFLDNIFKAIQMKSLIKLKPAFLLIFLSLYASISLSANISAGEKKASACIGCHGEKGISTNSQWPNLAGQQPNYLAAQLKAFKNGSRKNTTMQGMTSNLSDEDFANLAAYYASLELGSAGGGDPALIEKGKEKFAMCAGCHGSNAKGRGNFPALAGQHSKYIATQLEKFKTSKREGGPMTALSSTLSSSEITAIAAYLGSLK
jgi:cytochrome c553